MLAFLCDWGVDVVSPSGLSPSVQVENTLELLKGWSLDERAHRLKDETTLHSTKVRGFWQPTRHVVENAFVSPFSRHPSIQPLHVGSCGKAPKASSRRLRSPKMRRRTLIETYMFLYLI